jgi:hypothetical protein
MSALSLTPRERELLKNPRFFGTRQQLQPLVRQFAQPGYHYKLTSIPNTMITCTGCQGSRFVLQEHADRFGIMTKERCPICSGTGLMSNRMEAGY